MSSSIIVDKGVYYAEMDRYLKAFQWTMTAASIYAIVWTIIFGIYRYDYDDTCSTDGLKTFGTVGFWCLLCSAIVLLICMIWLWTVRTFRNVKLAEGLGFNLVGLLFVPLWLIVLVWGYVAGARNANSAGCGGLYYSAWVFAILTSVYIVLDCIEICVLGAFVGKGVYTASKTISRGEYAPVNDIGRVDVEPARVTVFVPQGVQYSPSSGENVNYVSSTQPLISQTPVATYGTNGYRY